MAELLVAFEVRCLRPPLSCQRPESEQSHEPSDRAISAVHDVGSGTVATAAADNDHCGIDVDVSSHPGAASWPPGGRCVAVLPAALARRWQRNGGAPSTVR